jgi:hypothetical protein
LHGTVRWSDYQQATVRLSADGERYFIEISQEGRTWGCPCTKTCCDEPKTHRGVHKQIVEEDIAQWGDECDNCGDYCGCNV